MQVRDNRVLIIAYSYSVNPSVYVGKYGSEKERNCSEMAGV